MDPQQAWIVNRAGLIYESLDGEVIAIRPETGSYYSLDAVASMLWSALETGASLRSLAECAVRQFGVDAETAATDCAAFLARLEEEGLVVAHRGPASGAITAPAPAVYAPPTLQRYNDMEEFFLLDPVHEVDEAGWPLTDQGAATG